MIKRTESLIYDEPVEIMISIKDFEKMPFDFRGNCVRIERVGKMIRVNFFNKRGLRKIRLGD
jgi:hypothetical protein